jgi:hypothetical protein
MQIKRIDPRAAAVTAERGEAGFSRGREVTRQRALWRARVAIRLRSSHYLWKKADASLFSGFHRGFAITNRAAARSNRANGKKSTGLG